MSNPNDPTPVEPMSTVQQINNQIPKFTILSILLSTGAFIPSMIFRRVIFTPVAFALVALHHGWILLAHRRWYKHFVDKGTLGTPLYARIPMIGVVAFTLLLWIAALAQLIDFAVEISSSPESTLPNGCIAGMIELAFVAIEIIALITVGFLSAKVKKIIKGERTKIEKEMA